MNVSVNSTADVQMKHYEQLAEDAVEVRGDKTTQQQNSESNVVPIRPDVVDVSPQARLNSVVSNARTQIETDSEDYKFKMTIERQVGDRTVETELNFYKRTPENEASGTGQLKVDVRV